jgi:bacteriorhodopsin
MKRMLFWDQVVFALHGLSVATVLVALGQLHFQKRQSFAWRVVCWVAAIPPALFSIGVLADFPSSFENVFLLAMHTSLIGSSPLAAVAAISATRVGRVAT